MLWSLSLFFLLLCWQGYQRLEAMGITKIVTVIIVMGVTPGCIQGDGRGGGGICNMQS